jgi:tRNA modification GTPase
MLLDRARSILPAEKEAALNARHRTCLAFCLDQLNEALRTSDLLIAAETIRLARGELDRITGKAGVEDMLDALFGTFCIGK